jgi:hypothetical protein
MQKARLEVKPDEAGTQLHQQAHQPPAVLEMQPLLQQERKNQEEQQQQQQQQQQAQQRKAQQVLLQEGGVKLPAIR